MTKFIIYVKLIEFNNLRKSELIPYKPVKFIGCKIKFTLNHILALQNQNKNNPFNVIKIS